MQNKKIIRDLGGGLILRHGSPEDGEALALFNGEQLGDEGLATRDGQALAAMTRDIFSSRPHISLTPNDFTIVEETSSGRIVSSMCLIAQTWKYDDIEFGMGRPEYVATHPDFRKRGLIRAQFDTVHQWCEERGLMVQGITGISYFYRQFGYEYALNLGGRRFGSVPPKLKIGEKEKFVFRAAEEKDIPFLMSTYEHGCQRSLVSGIWPREHWHNNLYEMSAENIQKLAIRVIQHADTLEPVGYIAHPEAIVMAGAYTFHYELQPEASWLDVSPSVARYLWNKGQEYSKVENKACDYFGFFLGGNHPVYNALSESLPLSRDPYAWYVRLPDLIGFLNHIKPVLDKRLAESVVKGHSGEYLIGMYPNGFKLTLAQGLITGIDPWKPDHADHGNAGFPALTFLKLLFGYRSYEDLRYAFPDCWWDSDKTRLVLNALFPKQHSNVYGIV